MANFLVSFTEVYLRLFLFPVSLRIDHAFRAATSLADPRVLRAVIVSLILAAGLIWSAVHSRTRFLPKHLNHTTPAVGFASLLLLLLAARTHLRGWDWSDDRTLNIANWEVVENPPLRGRRALEALYLSGFSEAAPRDTRLAANYLEGARKNLQAGLKMWPEDAELNRLMGLLLFMGDSDPAAAKPYADRAILTDPGNWQAQQLVDLVNTRLGV